MLTSVSGKMATATLDMGGFGISRYRFDEFLYKKSEKAGTRFLLKNQVKEIKKTAEGFEVLLGNGEKVGCTMVIGAHGKRSTIDKSMNRGFISKRTGYLGVKYHIKTDFPGDSIALHNFEGGYCGISKVENETYNLCYLGQREHLRRFGNVKEMERQVLFKNPFLKPIFENSNFLFTDPIVINEFSFDKKEVVENDVPMIGDAAGLITPLCGNGMAMAIHSAKILAEMIILNKDDLATNRSKILSEYERKWNKLFSFRLSLGRMVQNLFGSKRSSNFAVNLMKRSPFITRKIIENTHGEFIE